MLQGLRYVQGFVPYTNIRSGSRLRVEQRSGGWSSRSPSLGGILPRLGVMSPRIGSSKRGKVEHWVCWRRMPGVYASGVSTFYKASQPRVYDVTPFGAPGSDHRPRRGGLLLAWDANPGADADSQGDASGTQGDALG